LASLIAGKLPKNGRPKMINKLNREFALVTGSSARIIRFEPDGSITPMSLEAFKILMANRQMGDLKGEALVDAWLSDPDRREYRGFTCRPGGNDDDGLLNLWRGLAIKPERGDPRPILDFIHQVICNKDDQLFKWVISWIAQAVQRPHEKPGTAIILVGPQGTGKSTFGKLLTDIFGPHAMSVHSAERLTRLFNFHLKDKCIVVLEEAPLLRRHANAMKDLITNPRMMVEPKGVDAFEIDNHVRIVVCTNELHALAASADERRYCVIRVSSVHQEDHAYFGGLYHWMENGGLSAFVYFLQRYPYSKVNLRRVPRTKALLEQQQSSFSPLQHFVWEALQSGHWPNGQPWDSPIDRAWLLDAINDSALYPGQRVNATQLGQQLKAIFPDLESPRPAAGSKRPRLYKFPPLEEARKRFSEYVGQPLEWENLEEP
jgi:hypothetical protein